MLRCAFLVQFPPQGSKQSMAGNGIWNGQPDDDVDDDAASCRGIHLGCWVHAVDPATVNHLQTHRMAGVEPLSSGVPTIRQAGTTSAVADRRLNG